MKKWFKRKAYVNRLRTVKLPMELKIAEPVGKAKYGVRYKTRMGRIKLRERLDVFPLLVSFSGLDVVPITRYLPRMLALPQVKEGLKLWLTGLHQWQIDWAKKHKFPIDEIRFCKIYITSDFRPIGETAGSGAFADKCGALDSTDDHGHWKSALDVGIHSTMGKCYPEIPEKILAKTAKSAGFDRPFKKVEAWHFRFKCQIIEGG